MTTQLGLLERLGRACAHKPLRTIGIWLVILIAAFGGHRVISGVYQNSINLHGTQASTGFSLLKRNDPASSGYTVGWREGTSPSRSPVMWLITRSNGVEQDTLGIPVKLRCVG
jgi:hypothetical protein